MPPRSFRSASWVARAAALVLGALPLAAAAQPQATPYVGVDPGTVRGFDLRGGRILDPLPFDVQFYLQSKVDDSVAEARTGEPPPVTGRVRGAKEPLTCDELFPPEAVPSPTRFLCPAAGCPPAAPEPLSAAGAPAGASRFAQAKGRVEAPIQFVRLFQDTANGGGRTVEVSVPALPPNRSFCFEFRLEHRIADLDEFRQQIGVEIDRELRDPRYLVRREGGPVFVATAEGYNGLRQRLIGAILAKLRPGERLVAPPNSFFDPGSSLVEIDPRNLQRFNDLIEDQNKLFPALENYDRSRLEAAAALGELIDSPGYAALAASSQARELLAGGAGVLALGKNDALRAAQGLAQGATAPDLANAWTADAVAPQVAQLRSTLQDLRALQSLVERIAGSETLAAFFGLDQAATGELMGRVKTAADWIDKTGRDLAKFQNLLVERSQGIQEVADSLGKQLTEVVRVLGTTTAPYEIRAGWYLSADAGAGLAWDVEETFTYAGMNVYFRPVNKKAPLRGSILKRFSIMLGMTNENLEQTGKLKGVIGTSPLVVAGGFRINESLRLSLGALVFHEENPDPLLTDQRLTWTPFVSLSVDWNLRGLFKRLGGAFAETGGAGGP